MYSLGGSHILKHKYNGYPLKLEAAVQIQKVLTK